MANNDKNTKPETVNLPNNGEEDLKAELERYKKENQALKQGKAQATVGGAIQVKVLPIKAKVDQATKKVIPGELAGGGLCFYGLTSRFPFTFHPNQAVRMLNPRVILAGLEEMDKHLDRMRFKGIDSEVQEMSKAEVRAILDQLLPLYRAIAAKAPPATVSVKA